MKKPDVDRVLCEAGIDFEPVDAMLLIHSFYANFFHWQLKEGEEKHKAVITRGLKQYHFINFFEAMLWYRFYTCKRGYRVHGPSYYGNSRSIYFANSSYMSRIPADYKAIDRVKGLAIVREALSEFVEINNGIPKYYSEDVLNETICHLSQQEPEQEQE
ncbi:hypothetical protein BC940DRAFT_44550 [Gongronella butleri]|nr:hypothetical protein BC940DRAFT_44550 [Gongronella butleri]